MKKIRIFAALLAAILLAGILPLTSFAANPAITVSTANGTPGKEVSVTVRMTGNPGVCAGRLSVSYGEYLELTDVVDGGVLSGAYFGADKTANPYYVTWDDSLAAADNTKNGTLVTLKFKVRSDAPTGSQPVKVSYVPGDFVNVSLKSVSFTVTNGSVKVRSGALSRFIDVDPDAYYAEPVNWAIERGITAGTGPTTFSPEDGCTRAQVVTFLWRTEGEPEPAGAYNPFRDVGTDDYFYKAVLWAVGCGITKGTSDTTFSPDDVCTRGQIVTFLWRSVGSPKPLSESHGFRDVAPSDYFLDPVLWAVETGVTKGTSDKTFSPEDECTRAQVVTFLKRSNDAKEASAGKTNGGEPALGEGKAYALLGGSKVSDSDSLKVKDLLIDGMRGFTPSIDVREFGLDDDQLQWIYQEIINTVPDLFYVELTYRYYYNAEGKILEFIPIYTITDPDLIASMKTEYEAQIDAICSLVDPSWSDLEKALFVHDYIVSRFKYDTTYKIHDVYNFFKEGRGVCQAYTLLYIEILRRCGIEADAVISTSMNHTWNRVRIGGKWYHVDLAWDDPVPDQLGYSIHRYFLVSDDYLTNPDDGRRPHYGWKGYGDDIVCSDRKYESAIWKGVSAPFVPFGGSWYFIGIKGDESAIMKTDDLKNAVAVKTLPDAWTAGSTGAYWVGYFSGFCRVGNLLVYNTPREIRSYDPVNGIDGCLFRLPNGGHDIYGVTMRDEIYYAVQSAPAEESDYIAPIASAARYDADGDGYIAMRDLVILRRYLRGDAVIVNRTGADADVNGSINEGDVPALKAYLAGN